ncbi:DinB family protein [Thiocystis violacea]|uniref:DinB family protein n=1 Tax=Thiocystis violacea TaxID=13725 RepID=UPI001904C875|nr:DinB family protein [Thiocystis violacea]MBK1719433.1 hypothetical protein [Thiocystis violacea]
MTRPRPSEPNPRAVSIPAHERLVADLGVRLYASLVSPARILDRFRDEAQRAIDLTRRISEEQGRRRVSIRRFAGIESSSRDWSVYMTLDHLVRVNTAITALIHAICSDRHHGVEILFEDVEPRAEAGADRIQALEILVDRYDHQIQCLGHLLSRSRYPHPWFGPLNARQWHALATLHNRTHRLQIEKIIRRLD